MTVWGEEGIPFAPLVTGVSAKDCSAFSSVSISYVDISFAKSLDLHNRDDADESDEKDLSVGSVPTGRKVIFFIVLVIGGLPKDDDCVKALLVPTRAAAVSEYSVRVILFLAE